MTEERHVYLEAEEFEAFLRGVPVERETDGLDLTIFPPQDPGVRQWASRLAERRDREDDFLVLVDDARERERQGRGDMSLAFARIFSKLRRENTVMIFDEAGSLDPRREFPEGVRVVRTVDELADAVDEEGGDE